ncbi:hypothetical protein KIN34_01670 [Cellulomonas sp. DKR-3]|uniref:HIRAN domain-containing protein n=1 Tax=Cellulomonas fulva TaxID=2835530 RepID=A0ABS5TV16_9CELL|nr:hypothetical protein [Cellulomonas fulva]MBT0992999.1 hypothetical protein [Cellulomonas fulva]
MSLLRRRPRERIELAEGFHAAEAPALQRAIVQALGNDRHGGRAVPAEVQVQRGRDGHLALVWRNGIVGFVPREHVPALAGQLARYDERAVVLVDGSVHPEVHAPPRDGDDAHGVLWRIWLGPAPAAYPEPPAELDALPVPERTILGVPVSRLRPPS